MKPEISALCNDKLQHEAAVRFGLDPDSLAPIGGFENIVIEAGRGDEPFVIRFTHSSHREPSQIEAELDWLDFLAGHDIAVCKPLKSKSGRLTEVFEVDDGSFAATVFEKAKGEKITRDAMTSQRTFNRGKLVGQLHRLTREYQSPEGHERRHSWYSDGDFAECRQYLEPKDEPVARVFEALIAQLVDVPTSRDDFGVIHMDTHHGNMFFDGDQPILFDFDDAAEDFFVSDIAISLFYQVPVIPEIEDRDKEAHEFLHRFLEGYRTEYGLDNKWLDVIPMILRRREMVLYVALHRALGSSNFDDWCQKYIDTHRPRILDETPYVNLDWSKFRLS